MTALLSCTRSIACVVALVFQALVLAPAYAFDTQSKAMILFDDTTGQVLLDQVRLSPTVPLSKVGGEE